MYIRASCFECDIESARHLKLGLNDPEFCGLGTHTFEAQISTATGALVECPKGHKQFLIVQDGGYALLYERALERLAEGATRDAVLDAYTAFDMYLSHIPARARYDREKGGSPHDLREELKHATRLSERSIGAALAVASLVSGEAPPKIASSLQNIRNDAVHQGKYPTLQEAEELCLEVERLVVAFETALSKQPCVNEQSYWLTWHLEECIGADDHGARRVFAGRSCVLDPTRDPRSTRATASDRLLEYRRGNRPRVG